MALTADWKKAKTTFETETGGKKKPTEKFIGLFRKGTGIESALKAIETGKKADDVRKAIKELDKAATTYFGTLQKASTNATIVPADQLATYREALKKLQTSLEKIKGEADHVAEQLAGAGGKDKVDLKALKEAEDFLNLRKKVLQMCKEWLAETKKQAADVEKLAGMAERQAKEAQKYAQENNALLTRTAFDVVARCLEDAQPIVKAAKEKIAAMKKGGSDLMTSRTDNKGTVDKLPENMVAKYKADSGKLFNESTTLMQEQTKAMTDLTGALADIEGSFEQAEAYVGVVKEPEHYISLLEKLFGEIDPIRAKADDRQKKIEGLVRKIPDYLNKQDPKEGRLKTATGQHGVIDSTLKISAAAKKKLVSLSGRVEAVPGGALSDRRVADAVAKARRAAVAADNLFTQIEREGADALKQYAETIKKIQAE